MEIMKVDDLKKKSKFMLMEPAYLKSKELFND